MTETGRPLQLPAVETDPFIARVAAMNQFRRQIGIREVEEPWFSEDGTRMWVADGGMFYFIAGVTTGFVLYQKERNDPYEVGVFHRFAEAEKFLIRQLWDGARGSIHIETKDMEWWNEGPDSTVSITEDGHKRLLVLLDDPESRCVISSQYDAIPFTHAMVLSVDELGAVMRQGIPTSQ